MQIDLYISNTDTPKSMSLAYFRSIMKHGIIFFRNSSNSIKIFTSPKKTVITIAGVRGDLFKRLKILPLPCENMLIFL
jgi:hypothetical protein